MHARASPRACCRRQFIARGVLGPSNARTTPMRQEKRFSDDVDESQSHERCAPKMLEASRRSGEDAVPALLRASHYCWLIRGTSNAHIAAVSNGSTSMVRCRRPRSGKFIHFSIVFKISRMPSPRPMHFTRHDAFLASPNESLCILECRPRARDDALASPKATF